MTDFDPLKELGCYEASNQWLLYDERLQKFFDFFKANIRESNILTEHEVLEYEEIPDLHESDVNEQKQKLEQYVPGLLKCGGDNEAAAAAAAMHSNEISANLQAKNQYLELLELTRGANSEANLRLSELEHNRCVLKTQEKQFLNDAQCLAKKLETLQGENQKLYKETQSCYTSQSSSPPLLFCQLPLEKYFIKCDSFLHHFTLYIRENYKFQELETEETKTTEELQTNLNSLKNLFTEYGHEIFKAKAKVKATQAMIDEMDLHSIIRTVNLDELERESFELKQLNEHHLSVAHGTLHGELKTLVERNSQQRIEAILFENTKHKLERALKRLDIGIDLKEITSNALSNAELVWIAIQLETERVSKRIDYRKELYADYQATWRRIRAMKQLNIAERNASTNAFLKDLAVVLNRRSSNVQCLRWCNTEACLDEYENFVRSLANALQNMLTGRAYCKYEYMEQLNEFKRFETLLEPLVYEGPTQAPVLYDVNLLHSIHDAETNLSRIGEAVRQLRLQFQANIVKRMDEEPLWHASQMLWIWFLEQPQRLLTAMEDVKRAATAHVPAYPGGKSLGGIRRK